MVENSSEETSEVVIQGEQSRIVEIEIKPEQTKKPTGDEPCSDQPLETRIEALLLSSDRPLTEASMGDLLGISGAGTTQRLRDSIDELNEHYAKSSRSFRIEKLAGGWQMLTLSQFGPLLTRLHADRQSSKLSHAALETLSIIAYRQPIIRAEVESIRGVESSGVMRNLADLELIEITGRKEVIGHPSTYGTTEKFLRTFALRNLRELPSIRELRKKEEEQPAEKKPEENKPEEKKPEKEESQS